MVLVSMQAWILAIFCLTCAFVEASQQDSCAVGIKTCNTLAAKMDKVQADVKAIAHSLSLLNPQGGKTGFDARETKLPTYWSTPFSKICLAMKIGYQMRSIVIERSSNSLYSLIADGRYRATSLGRHTWKSLIGSQASLQKYCNKEGFNVAAGQPDHSRARIGILGNNENHCYSCDSRVGFGTGGNHDNSNTCGNEAMHQGDHGNKHIKAMGYILVQ